MVGCADHDDVGRQPVDLQQQGGNDSFDLAGLVRVGAFLGDRVELVEEQDAPAGARELEHAIETTGSLAEKTGHDPLVTNHVEGQHRLGGDRLGQARLAVTGRSFKQDPVARLDAVTA